MSHKTYTPNFGKHTVDGRTFHRNPLAGVEFASDEAAELAMEYGLAAGDFGSIPWGGKTGYTVKDIHTIRDRDQAIEAETGDE